MALRSVVDLDINDAGLDRLQAKIEKYQATLKNLPSISPSTGRAMREGLPGARGGETPEERAVPYAERLARAWGTMRENSREVVRNVREMQSRFLTIAGLMGTLTGLATGFGFLGFDKLAQNAANLRRQSQGFGTTPGRMMAARTEFGRFVDVDKQLGNIRGLQLDPTKPGFAGVQALLGRQLKPDEDTANVLAELLPKFQEWAQKQQGRPGANRAIGLMADKIFGPTDPAELSRLLRTSPAEMAEAGGRFRQQSRTDIPDAAGKAFQDFTTRVAEAGDSIQKHLINGLAPLAEPLANLTKAITNLVTGLMDKVLSASNINALADGIDRFAKYLGSDEFQKDLQTFGQKLGEAVSALEGFVGWVKKYLPGVPTTEDPGATHTNKPGASPGDIPLNPFSWDWKNFDLKNWLVPWDKDKNPDISIPLPGFLEKREPDPRFFEPERPHSLMHPSAYMPGRNGIGAPGAYVAGGGGTGIPIVAARTLPVDIVGFGRFTAEKEKQKEEPTGPMGGLLHNVSASMPGIANDNIGNMGSGDLISRIAKVESGFNPDAVSRAGAQGLMQFMPDTWKRFGEGSPFDPIQSIKAAKRYLAYLSAMPELGGDQSKIVASYNAGEAAVTAAVKQYGADWLSHLPKETQDYVPKVLGGGQSQKPDFHPAKPPSVGVTIQNETGGNVVTAHRLLAT